MHNWPFPFFVGGARVGGMERCLDEVLIAQFHLRLGRAVLEAQIYWPSRPQVPVAAPLVVLLADEAALDSADLLGRGLSASADAIVLRVPDRAQCLAALMWAADHAHELGGQRDRLMVAGCGVSGARAARLATIARDNGWPVLHRQVLVHPRFTSACPPPQRIVGVAAATIVSGNGPRDEAERYAARLRRAGVEVIELRQHDEDQTQLIAELGRSWQTKGSIA
jgi:alpha/beta hydrolase family protein